jgi:outer membrane lipoprotein-sorting protein
MFACGGSSKVDTEKLDSAYFIGEYQTDYKNEIEKITLKENGYYTYAHGKNNDTIIIDAGKWFFNKYSATHQSIELTQFPLIRKNVAYEDTAKNINLNLDVNTSVSYLGDLYDIVGIYEDHYTFVKLDKSQNKDYIKK